MFARFSESSRFFSAPFARYALASLGPFALAGSQFILLFEMLHTLNASDFGMFSFLLVVTQLCLGISSALLCGPLATIFNETTDTNRPAVMRGLFAVDTVYCLASFAAVGAFSLVLGATTLTTLLFASYAAASMLRWFGRAYAYARANWMETVFSDILSSLVILGGAGILAATKSSLAAASMLLLIGAAIGLAPFGIDFIRAHLVQASLRTLTENYGPIWQRYSRWTLLGVVTTEATANSHAYIVTLVNGPNAFALLAASALIIRPLTVVMNALSEFERPVMARKIASDVSDPLQKDVQFFRLALAITWLATGGVALVLLTFTHHLLFPAKYDLHDLFVAIALWMVVALARLARMPESTVLQAAGRFRQLAYASVISSVVSVVLVTAFVLLGNPVISIAGVLAGEILFAAGIWRQMSEWKQSLPRQPKTSSPAAFRSQ